MYSLPCPADDAAVRQRAWDTPAVARDRLSVWQSASTETDKARLTAIRAQHSSDWLFALPISAFGLRLGDEAIRCAVGQRLGLNICEPHTCPCGASVDAWCLHGLACKRSAGRSNHHQQLNDLIWRALKRADIPSTKEPTGLLRGDGKRPDGLTLVPCQAGKCLTWDATVVDTLASSYVSVTATRVGGAADAAAERKSLKYASITNTHIFVPVAIETLGPISSQGLSFLMEISNRLATISGDARATSFLFQRVSVLIQRFNQIAFRGTFIDGNDTEG